MVPGILGAVIEALALTRALSLPGRGDTRPLTLALSLKGRGDEEYGSGRRLALSLSGRGNKRPLTLPLSRRERGRAR